MIGSIIAGGLIVIGAAFVYGSVHSQHESAPIGCLFGLALMVVAVTGLFVRYDSRQPDSIELIRSYNARATIDAATAVAERRHLEHQAELAATAAAKGWDE